MEGKTVPKLVTPKNIPTVKKSRFQIEELLGVDLTNSPSNVDKRRSPDAPNMIRDVPGKVRKRNGYFQKEKYPSRINGVFVLGERMIVHAGDKLYDGSPSKVLSTGLADGRSQAIPFDGKLYLCDGKRYLCCGEFDGKFAAKAVQDIAYIPTVMISRNPDGGGTAYEPVNLLSKKFTDSFYVSSGGSSGTGEDTGGGDHTIHPIEPTAQAAAADGYDYSAATIFQLSFGDLDSAKVTAQKMNASGGWESLTEGTHFSVDRKAGKVTFTTAPGPSPAEGKDNVTITATRKTDNAGKINGCRVSVLYGVNGAADRMFLTGNDDLPNYDWYSQMNDPTYFGDTWYSILGQDNSRIMGYTILDGRLCACKDRAENGRNVIVRNGTLQEGKAAFPVLTSLQGNGAVARYSFGYMANEPLFLTRLGIYAITPQDVTGERYAQNRSFYLNGALCEETGLEEAFGFIYKDFYLLALNGKVYILDGLQRVYERDTPNSSYQYEGYYWTGIDARVIFEQDGALCFGTSAGAIMQFYEADTGIKGFNDCGKAIDAHWDMPDFMGEDFYRNKTVSYVAVQLMSAPATSVVILKQVKGIWEILKEEFTRARFFSWINLCWSKWSWSSDDTPRTIGNKVKIKKVDKVRFRFENKQLNEPFGIYLISLEFIETSYYKGR